MATVSLQSVITGCDIIKMYSDMHLLVEEDMFFKNNDFDFIDLNFILNINNIDNEDEGGVY